MNSPAVPFKVAADAALAAGQAAIDTAAGQQVAVLTEAPANVRPPYVITGEHQVTGLTDGGDCPDEAEVTSTLRLWSKTNPLDRGLQARALGAALIGLLAVELAVDGWVVDLVEVVSEDYASQPDQSTRGVLVLRYELTKSEA